MKIAVIIATLGRKELVAKTMARLENQTKLPDEVILSAPDPSHVPTDVATSFKLSFVYGSKGLCAQRNRALEPLLDRFDIVTFFDDDFLPADDYLEQLDAAFSQNPDWAAITGRVVHDGIHGPGIPFDEGVTLLEEARELATQNDSDQIETQDHIGVYGCNMSMRTKMIGDLRFDERLPLYGWQEDIDFTSQLRDKGRVLSHESLYGIHLGTKNGRVSGVRFGYSQIVNPVYLVKKGSMPALFASRMVGKNLLANIAKSFWEEAYVDRRGRLKGNLLAISHVLRGRIEPEHILEL